MTAKILPVTDLPVEMGAAPGQSWLVSRDTVDMTRQARPLRAISIAAEPQNIVIDANKTALLIVDMQNDFCSRGGWLDFARNRYLAEPQADPAHQNAGRNPFGSNRFR